MTLHAPRDATQVPMSLAFTGSGTPTVQVALYRPNSDEWIDWNDDTFKGAGWTSQFKAVAATAAEANLFADLLDLAAITNLLPTDDDLLIYWAVTVSGNVSWAAESLYLDDRVESRASAVDLATLAAVVDLVQATTNHRVVVSPSDDQVDVYDAAGTSILFSFSISGDRRERTPI